MTDRTAGKPTAGESDTLKFCREFVRLLDERRDETVIQASRVGGDYSLRIRA